MKFGQKVNQVVTEDFSSLHTSWCAPFLYSLTSPYIANYELELL